MNKISAVVITHNEASNIEACVVALLKVADEVLIVDSRSDDETVKIAHQLGAKIIEVDWKGYSTTKNLGNEKAN